MKQARNSSGDPYECLKPWPEDCFVQCGGRGLVLPGNSMDKILSPKTEDPLKELVDASQHEESYLTAFFEAFPKNPPCFIRGEGKTVKDAEENAFEKFEKILSCPGHEFEARGRKDGYGYCKNCTLSMSGVLPILNKCCKCDKPTNYTTDDKYNYYCEKHARMKPKSQHDYLNKKRIPRKTKKLVKAGFRRMLFAEKNEEANSIILKGHYSLKIVADGKWSCNLLFRRAQRKLIEYPKTPKREIR